MKRGEQTSLGKRSTKGDAYDPVDVRFSELIDEISKREWIVRIQLTDSQIARILDVSRATLYGWKNRRHEIAPFTAQRFLGQIGLRGFFSEEATKIHIDNQKKTLSYYMRKPLNLTRRP